MCADNAPSACIMRGCVFCADYAQMRIVRMCSCAVLRSVCICAACASAHVRCCAECAEAEPIARKQKTKHFPSYSRAGGRTQPKTMIFGHPRRKSLLNESRKVYQYTPATRSRRTQQKFSRPRAASEPLMQNVVILVALEHGRPCQNPMPAVCVDVGNLLKPQL